MSTTFDDTYTDHDFKRRLTEGNRDWIPHTGRREPDLVVDGLDNSLLARLIGLFKGRDRR
jgi:hypothetical protein